VVIHVLAPHEKRSLKLPFVLERVDEEMSHVLGSKTELKHRQNLCQGIDGQLEPEHLSGAAQPGSQFIQLDMREPEIGEEALVQGLCMLPSAREPGGDGGLTVAEHTLSSGRIQPFGQRREHHGDLARGSFQTVQGSVAPGSEGSAASETSKGLDALGTAMLAIPSQLYWLLNTSVRESGTLGFHRPPLSCHQVGFSHRKSRGMVFMYRRKQAGMGSRPSGKACKGCMRGLPKTSSDKTLIAGGRGPLAGLLHTWSRFRLPSGSHGAAHPRPEERTTYSLHPERKEPSCAVQVPAAGSLDGVVLG
jgi:hypothetical protein